MTERILENLSRQHQALKVLQFLQEEEFTHLREFRPQSVGALEFSIQELMRQIMAERMDARRMMKALDKSANRLSDVAGAFGGRWGEACELLGKIESLEKVCSKRAERTYALALALYDQSSGFVDFFTKKLTPKKQSYGPRGIFANAKPAPAMLRGTL